MIRDGDYQVWDEAIRRGQVKVAEAFSKAWSSEACDVRLSIRVVILVWTGSKFRIPV
jgi:hypothetical protein